MNRNYWLDLFTGTTWEEFKKHGATVSGFRRRRRRLAKDIHPGDYLLCYLTAVLSKKKNAKQRALTAYKIVYEFF